MSCTNSCVTSTSNVLVRSTPVVNLLQLLLTGTSTGNLLVISVLLEMFYRASSESTLHWTSPNSFDFIGPELNSYRPNNKSKGLFSYLDDVLKESSILEQHYREQRY
jgi:hypothetical protein